MYRGECGVDIATSQFYSHQLLPALSPSPCKPTGREAALEDVAAHSGSRGTHSKSQQSKYKSTISTAIHVPKQIFNQVDKTILNILLLIYKYYDF